MSKLSLIGFHFGHCLGFDNVTFCCIPGAWRLLKCHHNHSRIIWYTIELYVKAKYMVRSFICSLVVCSSVIVCWHMSFPRLSNSVNIIQHANICPYYICNHYTLYTLITQYNPNFKISILNQSLFTHQLSCPWKD